METSNSNGSAAVTALRVPTSIKRLRRSVLGQGHRILHRGQHLMHAGEAVDQSWLVVAGVLKSYLLHEDGEEQVLDFHLPGDMVGLYAMVQRHAICSVVALDTCNVQPLDLQVYHADSTCNPANARRVILAMHQEILRLTRRLHMTVESTNQRLATFLLDFSEHQRRQGFSASEFRLPMRRRDLALYLGLATETLSRAFTRLRKRGLLAVDNYDIRILDAEGLRDLARTNHPCPDHRQGIQLPVEDTDQAGQR